jgi:DNA-binding MarR family transcriptional regulator
MLPEIELRKSIRTSEPAENLGFPEPRTSLGEIQRLLERAASRENRGELYETLATRAGLDLEPRACWLLYRLADHPGESLEAVSARLKIDPSHLEAAESSLVAAGMVESVTQGTGSHLVLTDAGRVAIESLATARHQSMTELLEGWDPGAHPEVEEMIRQLAKALLADDDKLVAEARPVAV